MLTILIGVHPMRASISLIREMPEGVYYKTLKARAEIIEGNTNDLLWNLYLYNYALQKCIDSLWELDRIPKKSQVHQLLYLMPRNYGFRAHVSRNIYTTALTLVKSAKKNKSSKPVIMRMTARFDYQDARVDIESHHKGNSQKQVVHPEDYS